MLHIGLLTSFLERPFEGSVNNLIAKEMAEKWQNEKLYPKKSTLEMTMSPMDYSGRGGSM